MKQQTRFLKATFGLLILLSTYLLAEATHTEPPHATKKMHAHANIG